MYLHGLGQDTVYEGGTTSYYGGADTTPAPSDTYTPPYVPPTQQAGAGVDWTGLLVNAVSKFTAPQAPTIPPGYTVNPQGQLVPATYMPPTPYYTSPLPRATPGLSPFLTSGAASGGGLFGMNMTTLLMLGAIGVAAFIFLKK